MAELYSIAGLFVEGFPGISPWGGHFIRRTDINRIEGQLIDIYGPSKITGTMEDSALAFKKKYELCNLEQEFDFEFTMKNDVWVGEYSGRHGYNGTSICRTALTMDNLDFREIDCGTTEGYVNAIIESMVESEQLRRIKDVETGEDLIAPIP